MNKIRRSLRKRRFKNCQQRRHLRTELLEPRQLLAADANPFHNTQIPSDVNGDGATTLSDMRVVFTDLATNGARDLTAGSVAEGESGSSNYVDVNADGYVTPSDLRQVFASLIAEGVGEVPLEFTMTLKDAGGSPVSVATPGQRVILDVDIRDNRDPDDPAWPTLMGDPSRLGVFSAYFDFAHSANLTNAVTDGDIAAFPCGGTTCDYDHQDDYPVFNTGPSFPTVVSQTNDNGTPGDTTDDFEETVIKDLGGLFPLDPTLPNYGSALTNLVEIHLNVGGSDLTANNDNAQTPDTTPIDIAVLENDSVISELFFERREATGTLSEVSFTFGGEITPDQITDGFLSVPLDGVALGGLTVLSTSSGIAEVIDSGTPGDPSDDQIRFTPEEGGPGSATINYSISDGIGGTANAMVVVDISTQNDPPTHTTPDLFGNEEQPISFTGVSVDDIDADGGSLTTTVTLNNPAHGALNASGAGVNVVSPSQVEINGTLAQINAALDTMIFTGALDFTGQTTASITTNDNGNTGDDGPKETTDTININVANLNDDPIVVVPADQNAADDDTLDLTGLVDVTDVDSPDMTVALTLSSLTGAPGEIGVLNLGTTAGLMFDAGANNSESMTISGTLASVRNALGSLTYTPDDLSGFLGQVTVDVAANDQDGGTDADSFNIEVEPGVLPRARRDTVVVDEDSGTTILDVLDNDLTTDETSDPFIVDGGFTQPANGTVVLNDNGTAGDLTDDFFEYTPDADFAGMDTFTYTMDETPSQGGAPSVGTVNITVREENDAPTAVDDEITLDEDENVSAADFSFLLNSLRQQATPGGGADEASQDLTITAVTPLNDGATVDLTSLTLDPDFNDANSTNPNGDPFMFSYVVTDDGTTNGDNAFMSATGTVTVNINPVNDRPEGGDDPGFSGDEDQPITLSAAGLLANDEPGPPTATDEAGQTLVFGGLGDTLGSTSTTSAEGGAVTISGDTITYTPAQDFNGDDTFTYVVDDQQGENNVSLPVIVSLTVNAVNDPPIANDDPGLDAIKGVPRTIAISTLLANDAPARETAEDEADQPLSIIEVQGTANATVVIDGDNIIYTSDSEFSGTDTFVYTLWDGQGTPDDDNTDTATVTVEVADFIPSHFSGNVYVDGNGNGIMDAVEQGLGGITVTLTGTDLNGVAVGPLMAVTDALGHYSFENLVPGSYNVVETQPTYFMDGADTIGTNGTTLAANDSFALTIGAAGGVDSEENNFGELGLHPLYFSIEDLRASLPESGAIIGANAAGDQLWFSMLGNWDDLGPNATVTTSILADMHTVQVSVSDGNGSTQTGTFDTHTDRRVRIMGNDGSGNAVIRIEGDVADLFAVAEAEGEPRSWEQAIDAVARQDGLEDVDAVFAQLS